MCRHVIAFLWIDLCDEFCSCDDWKADFIYWSTCHRLCFCQLNNVILFISGAFELEVTQTARGSYVQIKFCPTTWLLHFHLWPGAVCRSSPVLIYVCTLQPSFSLALFPPSAPLSPWSLKTKGNWVAVELQTGCHGDCQRLCDYCVCVAHNGSLWDSQYHVVETVLGRLTNLAVVVLKHSVVFMRLVRLNVSFSVFFFFLQPEKIQVLKCFLGDTDSTLL